MSFRHYHFSSNQGFCLALITRRNTQITEKWVWLSPTLPRSHSERPVCLKHLIKWKLCVMLQHIVYSGCSRQKDQTGRQIGWNDPPPLSRLLSNLTESFICIGAYVFVWCFPHSEEEEEEEQWVVQVTRGHWGLWMFHFSRDCSEWSNQMILLTLQNGQGREGSLLHKSLHQRQHQRDGIFFYSFQYSHNLLSVRGYFWFWNIPGPSLSHAGRDDQIFGSIMGLLTK